MTTIILVTLFLASVIGFGLLMKHFRTKGLRTKENPIKPASQTPKESPEEEFRYIMDALIKTNLMIRKDRELPGNLLQTIETIIDDLKAVIPSMMEKYPGEALTWELKKIGRKHLGKTVKEYLDLSPESRLAQQETFKTAIGQLQDVVSRSRRIAEANETAEFKTMALFLGQKFS